MRFTRRRNGELMTTVRVQHHVGYDELACAIAYRASREGLEDQPQNPSRTWIMDVTREVLLRVGNEAAYFWTDNLDDDEEQYEVEQWAKAAVNGAFPELVKEEA